MTSWCLPWAKTKAGVITYWDGAGCRFEERDGCSTSAFWVSLSVRCLIGDTDREGCWVKVHGLCLETNVHIWNSRVGATCQSLGFRGAWLLLHPGRCRPHLWYCLSLLFIHSFVERCMSFLCRDYYKVQNDIVGLVFAWHVNGKNDLCQQRGKTGSEGLFLLHQSCWAPGGSFGVWLWVTMYWFSHSWWL